MNAPNINCPACDGAWDMPLEPGDPCPHCGVTYMTSDGRGASVNVAGRLTVGGDSVVRELHVNLVTVARFAMPHEAHLAAAVLDAAGIPAVLADEHTIAMYGLISNALGGVKLQVCAPDFGLAQEALSAARAAAAADEDRSE